MTIRDIAISFGYDVDKASEKKANDSVDKLKSVATKALGAIGIFFSIKGLASLAEAGANAEALKSQFSSVFGDMESQAEQSLKAIADETGVVTNRMKGSFVQIAAFAKTTGMETADAMGLSERAMRAVADSAAFYDKSVEEVTNSLQSFLKGNFAVDASLGLSATETTRNAAANALYGKSFKDLAEDQKQLTLLKMVEDANTLSGAYGQAAREADTWGNQLGNLKQNLNDLKATVGSSFLEPAVQVLKLCSRLVGYLNDGIATLTQEGRFLNRMFERMANSIKRVQDFVAQFISKIGGAEKALKLLTLVAGSLLLAFNGGKILTFIKAIGTGIGGINKKMLLIAAVIIIIALLVEDLINFMQGNDSLMGELFKKFGIDGEQVREIIGKIMESAKLLLDRVLELAKTIGGVLLDEGKKLLQQLLPFLMQLAKKIFPVIVNLIKRLLPLVMQIINRILPIVIKLIEKLLPVIMRIIESVLPIIIGLIERLLPFLMTIIETILPLVLDLIETLLPLLFEIIDTVLPVILKLIDTLLPLILQFIDTVLPIIISLIETLLPLIMQIIDGILPIIIELLETLLPPLFDIVNAILPLILELIEAVLPPIMEIVQTLLPVLIDWIMTLLSFLEPIIDIIMSLVMALLPGLIQWWEELVSVLGFVLKALEPVADVMAVIMSALTKVVDWVAKGFTWVVDLFTGGGSSSKSNMSGSGRSDTEEKSPVKNGGGRSGVKGHANGTNYTADTFIAGEEGPELVTGAKGRKVFTHAATGDIFRTLTDIARMGAAPRAETVAVTSSVENRSIVQNNQFTNQFYGDKAGQQKSAEAMEKSADDATGLLSRGLDYVR